MGSACLSVSFLSALGALKVGNRVSNGDMSGGSQKIKVPRQCQIQDPWLCLHSGNREPRNKVRGVLSGLCAAKARFCKSLKGLRLSPQNT